MRMKIPYRTFSRAANPNFLIMRPFTKDLGAVAVEFRTGYAITSKTSGLDVFEQSYVAERADGNIGLYERGKGLKAVVADEGFSDPPAITSAR
jgi:hypothetical protein